MSKFPLKMDWHDVPQERIYPSDRGDVPEECCHMALRCGEALFKGPYYRRCPNRTFEGQKYCGMHGGLRRDGTPRRTPKPTRERDYEIGKIGLTTRTYNCLLKANIHTLNELAEHTPKELLALRNFGTGNLLQVDSALARQGLTLKSDPGEKRGIPPVSLSAIREKVLGAQDELNASLRSGSRDPHVYEALDVLEDLLRMLRGSQSKNS